MLRIVYLVLHFRHSVIMVRALPKFSFHLEDILIRQCKFVDIGGVIYVNRKTLPENYSDYLFLSMYRIFGDIFFVAIHKNTGKIVGYCMNKLEENAKSFFTRENVLKGHIFSIGVLPDFRRRGIASALLAISMDKMFKKGCKELFLEVRVSNKPAQALYRKFNFEVVARIPAYYADGEDAYIMATNQSLCFPILEHILPELNRFEIHVD